MLQFSKPTKRPEPSLIVDRSLLDVQLSESYEEAKTQDLILELARFSGQGNQNVPGWSGFNSLTANTNIQVATIHYMPFIREPPTDMSTIYTSLNKWVAVAEKLVQKHILIIADLSIYSKAQQIIWSKPESLDGKVTMRLGGMHLLMVFIASIGWLFGDGGLLQLLIDTDVYADGTARQMLQGKQVSQAVRGLKLVLEALTYLFFRSAQAWSERQGLPWIDESVANGLGKIQNAFKGKEEGVHSDLVSEIETRQVAETLDRFRQEGRAQSATFTFWDNFIEAAHVILRLLRAEREGEFDLHLNATSETIPFFIAGGRSNYAKFTPVYITEMRKLKQAEPDSYKHLESGGFVVRRSSSHAFNCVSIDEAYGTPSVPKPHVSETCEMFRKHHDISQTSYMFTRYLLIF